MNMNIEIENVRFDSNTLKFTIGGTEYSEFYDIDRDRIGLMKEWETEYALSEHFNEDEVSEIVDQLREVWNSYKDDDNLEEQYENNFKM